MQEYGSKLWYDVIPNKDKLALTIPVQSMQSFTSLLEQAEVNYYGFKSGTTAKISVSKSDLETVKALVGDRVAEHLAVSEITKLYVPPEKNIFGTTEYKYISKRTRTFITAESEIEQKAILRTAEFLKRDGVKFSGRHYGEKIILTFSSDDNTKVEEIYKRVLEKLTPNQTESMVDEIYAQAMEKDVSPKPKISEEDINKANLVNLPQFLISHGFDLKKVGKEYIWKEHDSLHIKDNQFGERGQWFRFSEEKGGNNIQFLSEYMGMTFVEAVETLNNEQYSREYTYSRQHNTSATQEQKSEKELSIFEDDNAKRVIAYLCKTRGLDYNMVADLIRQGIISQEQKTGNILFKYFDENGNVIGAEKVGTSTEQKYKGIATGSESGRGFEVVRGTGESVYFFESAIDMLSYLQMNSKQLNNCKLVSMMGVKPNTVQTTMQRYDIAPENVYLCSDNDKAGNDFAQKLQRQYPEMNRISTPDTYKDWNDMLRGIPKNINNDDRQEESLLVEITTQIRQKQAAFTDLVSAGDFDNAAVVSQELTELTEQAKFVKESIQDKEITQDDVDALRDIEPKRKSVQNMLEPEVAQTPKFEKLLGDELGEKSPYEMRNGNLAWREDDTAIVPIIEIAGRELPQKITNIRKGVYLKEINRGEFVNRDTNMTVYFGRNSIDETVDNAIRDSKRDEPVEARIAALFQMQDIIENSICFDSVISEYDTTTAKNKSPNTLFMHKLYGIFSYKSDLYLANIAVEEMYRENIDKSIEVGVKRAYSFKGIKITPMELGGQTHGLMQNSISGVPIGVINTLTIPQLYTLVKEYDKNFYENEQAPGRVEREAEIEAQKQFEQSVKKLEEHNAEIQNETPSTSVPVDTKLENFDINEHDDPDYHEQQAIAKLEAHEDYDMVTSGKQYDLDQLAQIKKAIAADVPISVLTNLDNKFSVKELKKLINVFSYSYDKRSFIEKFFDNHKELAQQRVREATEFFTSNEGLAKIAEASFAWDELYGIYHKGGDFAGAAKENINFAVWVRDIPGYNEFFWGTMVIAERKVDGVKFFLKVDPNISVFATYEKIGELLKGVVEADIEYEKNYEEQIEEDTQPTTEDEERKTLDAVKIGDRFEYNGKDYTVTSLQGIYPGEVGVSYQQEDSLHHSSYNVTTNIYEETLLHESKYLGNIHEEISNAKRNAEKTERLDTETEHTYKPSFQGGEHDVSQAESKSAAAVQTTQAETEKVDYHITDEHIGEDTKTERFQNNIAAIKTLKNIESENRLATPDEQEILAKYVGWGGLADCFVDKHPSNVILRNLLNDEEYSAARESTLTAFYTPPVVMQAMYKKLTDMGFDGGKILEPSCGVGNFLGTMPEEIMRKSKVHAVELDSISGRIAQQLYQTADVQVKGFEKTRFNDNVFDVAIGNVPFGDISVRDKDYNKYNWRIHNYFFGKSLDKVRPGGIVAFLTSRYTLDSKNSTFRQYLAERADLLGAVRLPTGTFSKSAGTEVVSDIIFLQKREEIGMPDVMPDWVQTSPTADGFTLNNYFANNPEMVLGKITAGKGLYGRPEMEVHADESTPLANQLEKAMANIHGTFSEQFTNSVEEIETAFENAAPENLRNYSLFVQDNQVYFKKDDQSQLWIKGLKSETIAERAKAFVGLRDITRATLDAMVNDCSDEQLKVLQQELSKRYDDFISKYGIVHSRYNRSLFSDDISYQLVAALESKYDLKADPPTSEKSDLFTKRTIRPPVRVTNVDTAQEALAISMAEKGRVDLDFMSALYEVDKETIISELNVQIFPVPELSDNGEVIYQERSEYLSGDIRQKLNFVEEAAQTNPQLYSANIKALKDVMPEPLKAGDIDAKIGAPWIDLKYYEQFMYETFKTPAFNRRGSYRIYDSIELSYSKVTNAYGISHKSNDKSVFSTKTFGMDIRGASAYDIFENLLNFRDTKIYTSVKDGEGKEKRVVDPEKTKLAANKAKKIQDAFSEWIFKDPERREYLVNKYNEMYNSIRPREYDGSHLTFSGMNAEISLRPHQKDAIAHAIYGGNTLFDHSVGAGKTFEMIASIMERKRLGISNKALMVVPNHLTEQIGDDFQKLYPNANILVATKNDFSKENRRALISKIATGDYDAVIIGHTQLGMIPLSKETQEKFLQEEVEQLTSAIAEMKQIDGKSFGVKEAEKRKKNLLNQLEELQTRKDDIVTFEELGVDTLVLDEAHEFKNLHTPTNMQNVSGIGSSASKKASDLYMKCQYLNEKTGNKGLIFATGTPISNSVTELFTMQRYLQGDVLQAKRISHFDQWIGMFGHKVTDYQIDPTGKKFKLKTRIAKYTNMTELMSMFKSVADIKTADMMKLDVPDCETNIVNVEPTHLQQELVEELAFRADKVENGAVEPTVDNFLKITSDGRKVGLDPRLIDPSLEDNPNTKLNKCVENVFQIYTDTAQDKLTQLIFCDLGVPNTKNSSKGKDDDEEKSVSEKESFEEAGSFCIYDDIKSKLIAKGVKPDEIAFIHDAKTEEQKAKLFEKVRNGEVRVLLGSTPKMGTGTNIQKRLVALHDLDVPWRPADLEQRLGRMVRQGNMNKKVQLFRYVTKGTFDAYSYQTLENKQRYIAQLYTGNSRTCEDVDQQSLSYSEIKTLCTGDERLKEVMQLDNDISNLTALKRDHTNTVYEMQDKVKKFAKDKSKLENGIEGVKKDIEICSKLPKDKETSGISFEMKIDGITYTDKTDAAKQLERVFKRAEGELARGKEVTLATMYGFDIKVKFSPVWEDFRATVSGNAEYSIKFSEASFPTNIKRLMNVFDGMQENLQNRIEILARLNTEAKEAEEIAGTPFSKDTELSEKIERRNTLKAVLQAEQAAKASQGKDKPQTFHFSLAELKRNSKKIAKNKPPDVKRENNAIE